MVVRQQNERGRTGGIIAGDDLKTNLVQFIGNVVMNDRYGTAHAAGPQRGQSCRGLVHAIGERDIRHVRPSDGTVVVIAAHEDDRRLRRINLQRILRLRFQFDFEPERAAFVRRTLHANIAALQLDKVPCDGEAKAGAAKTIDDGFIGLCEALEDPGLSVFADADSGVGHLEPQPYAVAVGRNSVDCDDDEAAFGEFHGVARKIDQDLLEMRFVSDQ